MMKGWLRASPRHRAKGKGLPTTPGGAAALQKETYQDNEAMHIALPHQAHPAARPTRPTGHPEASPAQRHDLNPLPHTAAPTRALRPRPHSSNRTLAAKELPERPTAAARAVPDSNDGMSQQQQQPTGAAAPQQAGAGAPEDIREGYVEVGSAARRGPAGGAAFRVHHGQGAFG